MADSNGGWLNHGRKVTMIGMNLGTVVWVGLYYFAYTNFWPDMPSDLAGYDLFQHALLYLLIPSVAVFFLVSICFRLFDLPGAEDAIEGTVSMRWQKNARVLQNTVEQSVIFIPAYLYLSTIITADKAKALPILAALWGLGRLLYLIGYHKGEIVKGIGFVCTYYSSIAAYIWIICQSW